MKEKSNRYLAKCLAASCTAHLLGNSIEHEMRVNKEHEPGELYYALASLLIGAIIGQIPEDVERLNIALVWHPK